METPHQDDFKKNIDNETGKIIENNFSYNSLNSGNFLKINELKKIILNL